MRDFESEMPRIPALHLYTAGLSLPRPSTASGAYLDISRPFRTGKT